MKRNPIRILLLTVMTVKLDTRVASTQMIISPKRGDISCSGSLVVLTTDRGEKMSKSLKNTFAPWEVYAIFFKKQMIVP